MTRFEKAMELVELVKDNAKANELVHDLLARDLKKSESESARVLVEVRNALHELLAEPATAKELAEKAGVSKGRMVYVLTQLVNEGLVEKERESEKSVFTYKLA